MTAVAATLIAYAACEIAGGYGFLGVFVAALAIRASHRNHEFNREMHDFTEQVERIAMMAGLLLFGAALTAGLLAPLGWRDWLVTVLMVLVIRPVTAMIGLWGAGVERGEKLTLAFFGIRGIGTFYYLAYALNRLASPADERLWGVVGAIVLVSIVLHGLTVTPAMRLLDRISGRDPDALGAAHATPRWDGAGD